MTTTRDLIQRLIDALEDIEDQHSALLDESRAFLDQSETEVPTDELLGDLIDKWVQEAFRKKPYGCTHPTHTYVACKAFEHGRNHEARAYLAQPEPEGPTESDVSELFYRYVFDGDEVGFENAIAEALARWGRATVEPPAKPAHHTAQDSSQRP